MKKFWLFLTMLMLIALPVVAQVQPPIANPAVNLVAILVGIFTPIVVWGATELVVKKILPSLTGAGIITVVVPVVGAIIIGITQYIDAGIINPWLQGLTALLAVFFDQVLKQLKTS